MTKTQFVALLASMLRQDEIEVGTPNPVDTSTVSESGNTIRLAMEDGTTFAITVSLW
jgi:hypothetical protein